MKQASYIAFLEYMLFPSDRLIALIWHFSLILIDNK